MYLTADSETTLEKLAPDEVYIIGGIVDRNRFSSMCLDQATAKVHQFWGITDLATSLMASIGSYLRPDAILMQ